MGLPRSTPGKQVPSLEDMSLQLITCRCGVGRWSAGVNHCSCSFQTSLAISRLNQPTTNQISQTSQWKSLLLCWGHSVLLTACRGIGLCTPSRRCSPHLPSLPPVLQYYEVDWWHFSSYPGWLLSTMNRIPTVYPRFPLGDLLGLLPPVANFSRWFPLEKYLF